MAARRTLMVLGLILAAGASSACRAADDVGDLQKQAVEWFKKANVDGPDGKMVRPISEDIGQHLEGGHNVILLLPSDMTSTGKAYYAMTWAGSFFAFETSDEQLARIGAKASVVTMRDGPGIHDARRETAAAKLSGLKIDAEDRLSGDAPITGTVVCTPLAKQQEALFLRITYKLPRQTVEVMKPIRDLPSNGVLKFSIDPINKDAEASFDGPLPVFVDVCVEHGDLTDRQVEVVSNTIGRLLNVRPAAAAKTPATTLVGSKWKFDGMPTTVELLANGKLRWNGAPIDGFWDQNGDSVTIMNGSCLFTLTLKGDSLSGTVTRLVDPEAGRMRDTALVRVKE